MPVAIAITAATKCLEARTLRIMTSLHAGLDFGRSSTALFAPLPIVLVPPESFLQDGIDDMVRVALDELRIVIEQSLTGSSMRTSRVRIAGAFLTIGMVFLLLEFDSPNFPQRGKNGRHRTVPQGGSDPKNFLGGWKPEKWGRSRPFLYFFPPLLLIFWSGDLGFFLGIRSHKVTVEVRRPCSV